MAKSQTVSVPRLTGLAAPTDVEILGSEIMVNDQGEALALIAETGLCAFFDLGIVFLPALRSLNAEIIQGVAGIVVPFALSLLARDIKEQKDIQDLSELFELKEPAFPEWLQEARKHRDYFALPWIELVEATASFDGGFFGDPDRLTLVREQIDGTRRTVSFQIRNPQAMLTFLMQMRIKNEMLHIGLERLWMPKAADILPALNREYEERYGDALKDHAGELRAEFARRMHESLESIPEAVKAKAVQEVMQPILPYYARIPGIVKNQPWLFESQAPATPS